MKTKYVRPEIEITTISNIKSICTSINFCGNKGALETGDESLNALDAMLAKDRAEESADENFDW